jgi:hypothetical protein
VRQAPPVTAQRRASNTDFFMVTGQKLALDQAHAHTVLTIHIAEYTIVMDPNDGGQRTFRRITPQPFRNCKAHYSHVLRFLARMSSIT